MKKFPLLVGLILLACFSALIYNKENKVQGWLKRNFNQKELEAYEDENETEEEENDKPNELMLFHAGIRTRMGDAAPKYKQGYLYHELKKAVDHGKRISKSFATASSIGFVERGPNNVPGRITALLNLPNDPNQNSWLAGSATGGIWKTTDGGVNWIPKGTDFPALPISSFSIADDNTIYVGTGEYVSTYSYSALGAGIFKSTDFGESWTALTSTSNNPEFAIVTRLIVDPTNSNIVVASCVPSNTNSNDHTSSIMKTTDGGFSWSKAADVVGAFEQVIFTPGNFSVQYASQNGVGVWKSIDAGSTWLLSNSGMYPSGRSEIAVSPANTNYLFAACEGEFSGAHADLYLSKDAGNSWAIVDLELSGRPLDFLGRQGFYDDVVICDPFNPNIAYFGGVNLFQTKLNGGTSLIDYFSIDEVGTKDFLYLLSYNGIAYDRGRLTVGANNRKETIEVRFGPGVSQKAHRFLVPQGQTSGVSPSDYSYQDYVDVPFEVWDVGVQPNRQLMVSFRDQNRNGSFDLLHQYPTSSSDIDPLLNSREYLFINDVPYDPIKGSTSIGVDGGQNYRLMYSFFPALAPTTSAWDATNLPSSKLRISYKTITKLSCSTQTVTDAYGWWDAKNHSNQADLIHGVHPDHHAMIPIVVDASSKTYKLLIGNDGGVFVSKISTAPGTTDGDFIFSGNTLNTGQFYSADKCPGVDQYLGGMQDNGTRISPILTTSQTTNFNYAISGDGFEVLWNNRRQSELLGSVYYNQVLKSKDNGLTWNESTLGLNEAGDGSASPFYTKLTNSKDFPDRVFAVGVYGVYASTNFGSSWQLVPIADNFSTGNPGFMDVEVSRANANIVWAGSGMFNGVLNLHVSSDGGKTFNKTNNFADFGYLTKLASHPTEPSTAYAIFSFAGSPKILRTTDLGVSWQDITGFNNGSSTNGFPDVATFCVYVRPDNPNVIWAGTEIGIVESQDNGASWSLMPSDQFPHVSVFDMKGQDNQIIIATNGRGIWTYDTELPQSISEAPSIVDHGTSPLKELVIRVRANQSYDSVQVFVDNRSVGIADNFDGPGLYDISMSGVYKGDHNVYLIAYKNSGPVQSEVYTIYQLDILSVNNTYSNFFNDLSGVFVNGFELKALSNENPKLSLQSDHSYQTDKTYSVEFTHPIKVSATESKIVYSDIAIVATGIGKDSIIMEGSLDGLNWKSLAPSYNASSQQIWNNAYVNNISGNSSQYIQHTLDLKDTFTAGDVILIRIRFSSDHTNTAWGYALDYIFMQIPSITTAVEEIEEPVSVFPNPSKGRFTLKYDLQKASNISIVIYDITGRKVYSEILGQRGEGIHTDEMAIPEIQSGIYIAILSSDERKRSFKIVIEE